MARSHWQPADQEDDTQRDEQDEVVHAVLGLLLGVCSCGQRPEHTLAAEVVLEVGVHARLVAAQEDEQPAVGNAHDDEGYDELEREEHDLEPSRARSPHTSTAGRSAAAQAGRARARAGRGLSSRL